MRKCTKSEKSNLFTMLTRLSTEPGSIDRFVKTRDLKRLPRIVFSIVLFHFLRVFHISASRDQFKQRLDRLKALDWIFGRIGGQDFGFGLHFLPPTRHNQGFLPSRAPRVSVMSVSLSTSLVFFVSIFLMAPRRESTTSRAQGKCPTKPSQPSLSKARRQAQFETSLFSSMEDYQQYKQKFSQRKVVLGKSINFSQLQHFGFEGLFGRMGWLPMMMVSELIFLTLVRAFYSRVTYGIGGPIISTVRGVEIRLDLENIYHIFNIAPIGLKVYESKIWPTMSGFEPREVIQRMCRPADAQGIGKPSAHSLTMISRVLHHMICSILLPQGEHKDEVSYYEEFLVDSILTGRRIHLGYLMMMHMISCCESMTCVLPYGCFLTRVFKDVGVDLSRETYFEAPNIYEQSLGWMKFEKAPDGFWIRKAKRPPAKPRGQRQVHPSVEEQAKKREIKGGVNPQRGFQQRDLELDIPPLQ